MDMQRQNDQQRERLFDAYNKLMRDVTLYAQAVVLEKHKLEVANEIAIITKAMGISK